MVPFFSFLALVVGLAIVSPKNLFTILFFQHRLIYRPRRYEDGEAAAHPLLTPLEFSTDEGRQQAFYLPPNSSDLRRLWVVFPGKISCALDSARFLEELPDRRDGFLLLDYPGYGNCQGAPSPESIQESADAAFEALSCHLREASIPVPAAVSVFCHSLGCATGLNFASRHPTASVVLLAPFTSLHDMARHRVGRPFCWLLRQNYNNVARLRELAARECPPRVTVLHGQEDGVVPVTMSRRLAGLFAGMVTFRGPPGATHCSLFSDARDMILAAIEE